eukprot:GEMP01022628.1.p1 GENE.GEMP01022628.1~~GEMP01022628.1.p1  ORF type:complete len:479 (+),score=94.54 GEMP01022628.1:63-1499(+)
MSLMKEALASLSCRVHGTILLCNDGSSWSQAETQQVADSTENDQFWTSIIMSTVCISCAAMAAGLTMGLVSLEEFDMELLLHTQESDLPDAEEKDILKREKWCAQRIAPIIADHHLLLVTLLLLNACANEALPVFLSNIVPSWAAIIVSVTIVLFFGEIIPSALFTGPNQLYIAAWCAPIVRTVQTILFPIAKPIALILDMWLGHEDKGRYNKAELKALVALHKEQMNSDNISHLRGRNEQLSTNEALVMQGALDLNNKRVESVMLPMDKVKMLEKCKVLDLDAMAKLVGFGHSRIPVWELTMHNIRGILITKSLICINPSDGRKVESLGLRIPLVVPLGYQLMDLLKDFQAGKSHIALVCSDPKALKKCWRDNQPVPANVHMAGIITMEDVVEELIQSKIYDESDMSVKGTLAEVAFKMKRMERVRELVNIGQKKARKGTKRWFSTTLNDDRGSSLRQSSLQDPLLSPSKEETKVPV